MRTILYLAFLLSLISGVCAQSNCPRSESPMALTNPIVIGNGTPGSCTQAALQAALNSGGHIECNCGPTPVVISITSSLNIALNTVLDGGNLVTLDGNGLARIINKQSNVDFTVQQMRFINGRAPGPSGHFSNECGGAILARGGGTLKVIDCIFEDNTVTSLDGSDIAGGAVYVFGEIQGIFSGSIFINNSASNGGAIGGLGSDIIIANCKFYKNAALGDSGGLRGHGGAINLDGVELNADEKIYSVCGSEFIENNAYAQGGASNTVFSDNVGAALEIDQCYYEGNYLRANNAGNGGAIFHVVDDLSAGYSEQQFTLTRSTFYRNKCNRQGGAVWPLINGRGLIENCTFYRDSTLNPNHGLGGGLIVSTQTNGQGLWTVRNNTLLENYTGLFGGGVFAGGNSPTLWQNNILQNNNHSNTNPWVGLNTNRTMDMQAGTNQQWPQFRPNGSEDTKVTNSATFVNSSVNTQMMYQGGPTPTLALPPGSSAIGVGSGCPTTDQRLANRTGNCDIGAFDQNAMNLPTSVVLGGMELGWKHFISTQTIHADAYILSGADFVFESDLIHLEPGFELESGARLTVLIYE